MTDIENLHEIRSVKKLSIDKLDDDYTENHD